MTWQDPVTLQVHIFGGIRLPESDLNDLLSFDIASGMWTWLAGNATAEHPGMDAM